MADDEHSEHSTEDWLAEAEAAAAEFQAFMAQQLEVAEQENQEREADRVDIANQERAIVQDMHAAADATEAGFQEFRL